VARKRKDIDISKAASAMSKKRWDSLTEEERKAAMEKARTARQRNLSKARRVEIARLAVNVRWAKARALKQSHESAEQLKGSSGSSHTRKRKPKDRGEVGT
jgi:hypothetical protein